jgi:hypothetical protein
MHRPKQRAKPSGTKIESQHPHTWTDGIGKVNRRSLRNSPELSLYKSTNNYSLSTEALITNVIQNHPVPHKGSRQNVLMKVIGDLVHKFGYHKAREIAERHYRTYEANIRTPLEEHMKEFHRAWLGAVAKIRERFSPSERAIYDQLRTDHQREGFRIIWAFAQAAAFTGKQEFPIGRDSLADRISVTSAGAACVIQNLCDFKAIEPTKPAVRHKSSARFCWFAAKNSNARSSGALVGLRSYRLGDEISSKLGATKKSELGAR